LYYYYYYYYYTSSKSLHEVSSQHAPLTGYRRDVSGRSLRE